MNICTHTGKVNFSLPCLEEMPPEPPLNSQSCELSQGRDTYLPSLWRLPPGFWEGLCLLTLPPQ